LAYKNLNKYDRKVGKSIPTANEYAAPKPPVFRTEKEIEVGMKDFERRFKPDPIENPHALSVFDQKPRYQMLKEHA
jgi:hypothetical protein